MRISSVVLVVVALSSVACGGRLADTEGECRADGTGCDAGAEAVDEPRCGNGVVELGEQCDGSELNGQSCDSMYMGARPGRLLCSRICQFDTRACRRR